MDLSNVSTEDLRQELNSRLYVPLKNLEHPEITVPVKNLSAKGFTDMLFLVYVNDGSEGFHYIVQLKHDSNLHDYDTREGILRDIIRRDLKETFFEFMHEDFDLQSIDIQPFYSEGLTILSEIDD